MEDQILPKIAINFSQNHLSIKQGWYKDAMPWLKMCVIDEDVHLHNIDDIKNIITSKFKRIYGVMKV